MASNALKRRLVGLAERAILSAGMSLIAFALERQLTRALERPRRRGEQAREGSVESGAGPGHARYTRGNS
jgi:hypothetical protein